MTHVNHKLKTFDDSSPHCSQRKIDLVVYLDYLGFINVESKYLQAATIPWLIAEIKLLEAEKKIETAYMEINVKKNSINLYRSSNAVFTESTKRSSDAQTESELILSHKLTDVFKLTSLANDPLYFAYFYRQDNSFNYNLYAFYSSKFNITQVLHEFQIQALRIHESLKYEKIFDFKLVTKVSTVLLCVYELDPSSIVKFSDGACILGIS